MTKRPKQFSLKKKSKKQFNLKPSAHKRGYDTNWQKYTFRFRHHNPECYACGVHKDNVKIHVDHIHSAKSKPEWFWEPQNHIGLCIHCHSTVTQLFVIGRSVPDVEGKIKWINDKRQKTGTVNRVKLLTDIRKNKKLT